jgi:hypothetical protein
VNNPDGEKLSKQTGAIAFDRGDNDFIRSTETGCNLSRTDITVRHTNIRTILASSHRCMGSTISGDL